MTEPRLTQYAADRPGREAHHLDTPIHEERQLPEEPLRQVCPELSSSFLPSEVQDVFIELWGHEESWVSQVTERRFNALE